MHIYVLDVHRYTFYISSPQVYFELSLQQEDPICYNYLIDKIITVYLCSTCQRQRKSKWYKTSNHYNKTLTKMIQKDAFKCYPFTATSIYNLSRKLSSV